MRKVLTIAGSDSCCGAGVQADLKTINALGAYGTCAITAVTTQNTLGISSVFKIPATFVGQQIDAVISDIGVDALKTGMLTNEKVVEIVSDRVSRHKLKNLVVDPVIKSHYGEILLSSTGVKKLISNLIPLAYLVTPNIPEAEILAGRKIHNLPAIKDAAKCIHELGAANVLIKGGHITSEENEDYSSKMDVADILYDGKSFETFEEKRVKTENVHGTGCIYSAAIATELANGNDLMNSITNAKKFVTEILKNPLTLGKGYKLAPFGDHFLSENIVDFL
ncbi:MAG: bifunctional hydroxymethylpyrimidine kinase/phosphomethylpyrimidine kinase [Candidatus Scalindua sediminis]|nr:bifunctional hydroxymethylpyrimidine kinase/phosphomethylpyrimidine kinase [Candidatus Scalindua sediminis]HDY67204.1 bifunctional hydroxymethylpyrimidine kinase/phosphomethylpyrimidine kinase [Candidatus Scalindua sp.]